MMAGFGCRESEPVFVRATNASATATSTARIERPDPNLELGDPQESALPLDQTVVPDAMSPIKTKEEKRAVVTQVVASELEGKLTQEQVMNTIHENASTLVGCLATDSVISVRLKVLPSGKIGVARAIRSIPNDPKLRDCIELAIRKISFPKLEGTEPANLSLDLSLKKS